MERDGMTEKSPAKMHKYRLSPVRELRYTFDLTAKSPEGASKRLQERLKRDAGYENSYKEPDDATLFGHSWFPPDEMEFIISGGDLPVDPTEKTCHVWNGEKIVRKKIPTKIDSQHDRKS
jgi:hypothetical protein